MTDVELCGSGDVNFIKDFEGNNMRLYINGSGNIYTNNLVLKSLNGEIKRSGRIDVQTGEITDLKDIDSGSGDVRVFENITTVDATVLGSGSITLGQISERLTYHLTGSGNHSYSGNCENSGSCIGTGCVVKR